MEQFVRLVVAGGVVMVAGLWVAALTSAVSVPWLVGVALVVAGIVSLGAGIRGELTV